MSKKLRRDLRQQDNIYKQALKISRPRLNKTKELTAFDENATKTGKLLAKLSVNYMAVQTAYNYADSAIAEDLNVEGVSLDVAEGMSLARKIVKIEIVKILLNQFNVPAKDQRYILELLMNKEFSPAVKLQPSTDNTTNLSSSGVEADKRINSLEKDLKRVLNAITSEKPEPP